MKVKLKNKHIEKDYVNELLRERGIDDPSLFIHPEEYCLQDFHDLENIQRGVAALNKLPPIAHLGLIVDCDCDGYTSAAILYQYFHRHQITWDIEYFIHDGKAHGLEEHWKDIRDKHYDLLLVPDAGSNDAAYAKELDCPILILDHHEVDVEPSDNMIVINNQASPNYHNKFLSGAGMTFQFCRALDEAWGHNWAMDYCDLAALGEIGDMMSSLNYENQYIWQYGLRHINNYFFQTILLKQGYSISGITSPTLDQVVAALTPISISFYVAPLINAMVRSGTYEEKIHMFAAFVDGHSRIVSHKRGANGALEEVAVESARECTNARAHQNKKTDEVVFNIKQRIAKYDLLSNQILFIRLDDSDVFPSELNGLIAMKLAAEYKKPTIVARRNEDGMVRGSLRGVNDSGLESFKDYLLSTGLMEYVQGHASAAGISIPNDNISKLHDRANKELAVYNFNESVYGVDFERSSWNGDIADLVDDITSYPIVWDAATEPLIYIKDIHLSKDDIEVIGKNHDTIKWVKNGITYIRFHAEEMIEDLRQQGDDFKVEVVGKANMNVWMGRKTPQIVITNYEVKKDNLLDF